MVSRLTYSKPRARGSYILLSAGGNGCNMMYACDQLSNKIKLCIAKLRWNNALRVERN